MWRNGSVMGGSLVFSCSNLKGCFLGSLNFTILIAVAHCEVQAQPTQFPIIAKANEKQMSIQAIRGFDDILQTMP